MITALRGRVDWATVPFPRGAIFNIEAVATMFDVSKRRIYNLLSEHRARFDKPLYRARFKRGDRRLRRWLTEQDVDVLREFFRFRVKP